jgi:hypothetical protein
MVKRSVHEQSEARPVTYPSPVFGNVCFAPITKYRRERVSIAPAGCNQRTLRDKSNSVIRLCVDSIRDSEAPPITEKDGNKARLVQR